MTPTRLEMWIWHLLGCVAALIASALVIAAVFFVMPSGTLDLSVPGLLIVVLQPVAMVLAHWTTLSLGLDVPAYGFWLGLLLTFMGLGLAGLSIYLAPAPFAKVLGWGLVALLIVGTGLLLARSAHREKIAQ